MLKKVLKPILIILIALSSLILLIFLGTGGFLYDFGMLENSLIEYYSNDDSYETLTGEIIKIENSSLFIIKILSDNPNFTNHVTNIEIEFDIFGDDNWYESAYNNFAVGDIITFISAPMSFYNGQFIPIVSIEKDGEIYLEFNNGKESLLDWVKNQKWSVLG